jgi:hypothetical protein
MKQETLVSLKEGSRTPVLCFLSTSSDECSDECQRVLMSGVINKSARFNEYDAQLCCA